MAVYEADLRDTSWIGAPGHEHARPHDPAATRAFNEEIKQAEREKAQRSVEQATTRGNGKRR